MPVKEPFGVGQKGTLGLAKRTTHIAQTHERAMQCCRLWFVEMRQINSEIGDAILLPQQHKRIPALCQCRSIADGKPSDLQRLGALVKKRNKIFSRQTGSTRALGEASRSVIQSTSRRKGLTRSMSAPA